MNDRENFRRNLNYFLSTSGKMQKDLAEYVGAKFTTVSGWTRGVSYPRADAMEKIAQFFGVPTSRLVGDPDNILSDNHSRILQTVSSTEARIISAGIDKMPPERREQALAIMKAAFVEYADYFKEDNNNDA